MLLACSCACLDASAFAACLPEACCSARVLRSLKRLVCDRQLDIRLSSRLGGCDDRTVLWIVVLRKPRPICPEGVAGADLHALLSSAATCLYVLNVLPVTGRRVRSDRSRDGADVFEGAGKRKRAAAVFGARMAEERGRLDRKASCATLRLMLPHC